MRRTGKNVFISYQTSVVFDVSLVYTRMLGPASFPYQAGMQQVLILVTHSSAG